MSTAVWKEMLRYDDPYSDVVVRWVYEMEAHRHHVARLGVRKQRTWMCPTHAQWDFFRRAREVIYYTDRGG